MTINQSIMLRYLCVVCLLVGLLLPAGSAVAAEDLEALIQNGNKAFEQGDLDKALKIYEKGLKAAPKESVLFYNKGNVLYRQKKYTAAIEAYDAAIKNKPKKVLLKNITYNAGNAWFKLAEEKVTGVADATDETAISTLKEALSDYAHTFDMYRQSLELARKINIARGADIHKSGTYAKKNWALSRIGWTKTWEKIRELERKNLKLEDGIQNLLKAQEDLLPRLEEFYLNSFSEDSLKFNLKTLAEYHIDYQEDITHLQQLAEKEIQRVSAELENYKTAQKQSKDPNSQPLENDPELEQLKQSLKEAETMRQAVDTAVGYENWIIDGLKRGDPVTAWKNSHKIVTVLNEINDYLKKEDHLKKVYQSTLNELSQVNLMLSQTAQLKERESTDTYEGLSERFKELSSMKLDAAAGNFERINAGIKQLEENFRKEENMSPATPPMAKDDSAAGGIESTADDIKSFFETAAKKIVAATITDLMQRNSALAERLRADVTALSEHNDESAHVTQHIADSVDSMLRYETLQDALTAHLASMIQTADTVIEELSKYSRHEFSEGEEKDNPLSAILGGMHVLMFKYQVMLDELDASEKEVLNTLKENMPAAFSALSKAFEDIVQSSDRMLTRSDQAAVCNEKATELRDQLFGSLIMIAPEYAIALNYERVKKMQTKMILEELPATSAKQKDLLARYPEIKREVNRLSQLLERYFEASQKAVESITDQAKKDAVLKEYYERSRAEKQLERGSREATSAYEMLDKESFMAHDLLAKDVLATVEKSQMSFLDEPKDEKKALEAAIAWQEGLKSNSAKAIEIEEKERAGSVVGKQLSRNQTDIIDLSGKASRLIREKLAASTNAENGGNAAAAPNAAPPAAPRGQGGLSSIPGFVPGPPGSAPQQQQADPAKLKEAIQFIQDAHIEAEKIRKFIDAGEFKNTQGKHDDVIELLKKALEALRQSEKNKDQQQPSDQNQSPDNQQKQQQEQPQNEQGQSQQRPSKPLELTPEQARELLNQLNSEDDLRKQKTAPSKRVIDTPRPW